MGKKPFKRTFNLRGGGLKLNVFLKGFFKKINVKKLLIKTFQKVDFGLVLGQVGNLSTSNFYHHSHNYFTMY